MTKSILIGLSAYFTALAAFLLISPQGFYDVIPGVSDTGPFNSHMMRDVGFAFLTSASALFLGVRNSNRSLALFGAAFPTLHGGFHAVHWLDHGAPLERAALLEVVTTTGLALFTLVLALRVKGGIA